MNSFDNDYFEIFYRFALWFLLGFFLAKISGVGTERVPNKISILLTNPPKSDQTQIYGVIGILVCGVTLL